MLYIRVFCGMASNVDCNTTVMLKTKMHENLGLTTLWCQYKKKGIPFFMVLPSKMLWNIAFAETPCKCNVQKHKIMKTTLIFAHSLWNQRQKTSHAFSYPPAGMLVSSFQLFVFALSRRCFRHVESQTFEMKNWLWQGVVKKQQIIPSTGKTDYFWCSELGAWFLWKLLRHVVKTCCRGSRLVELSTPQNNGGSVFVFVMASFSLSL